MAEITKALSMSNLRRKKFNPVTFGEPWNSFLGSRELKGVWTIYGPSGHGKTSMAIQLANYLCQFGKVMYDSIEQGASESLIEAFRREGLLHQDGRCILEEFADLEVLKEKLTVPSKKNPNIRIEKKHTPKIIVIDSLNTLPVNSYKYVKELTDLLPNKLFILIGWGKMDRGQVKPDGAIVKKAIFYADVKIKVEAFRAYANARGNSKTTVYTISEEMAKIYEAQL